jgi:uncharacterized cysteine cluster protein YcgN (CxxCxxCC family)
MARISRLPVLHDLLGRVYSDAEWEGLCDGCGDCCYESQWTDTGWVHTGTPCRFLDIEKRCRVYSHRFQAEKDCIKVSPSVVLQGILPSTCAYVQEMHRIVEEDYDGLDPVERDRRKKKRRSKRKRKR